MGIVWASTRVGNSDDNPIVVRPEHSHLKLTTPLHHVQALGQGFADACEGAIIDGKDALTRLVSEARQWHRYATGS